MSGSGKHDRFQAFPARGLVVFALCHVGMTCLADGASFDRLVTACRNNDTNALARLLIQNPEIVKEANGAKVPLVAIAARGGSRELVEMLVARGATPDARDPVTGHTALELALPRGDATLIDWLAARSSFWDLPSYARLDRPELALDALARTEFVINIKPQAIHRYRVLCAAEGRPGWTAFVGLMERARVATGNRALNVLRLACTARDPGFEADVLPRLVPAVARHLSAAELRELALEAITQGHRPLLEMTMRAGLRPDKEFSARVHELFARAETGIAIALLDAGLIAKSALDDRLLHAAADDDAALVRRLLDLGADKNARGERMQTPLMEALSRGRDAVVEELLQRGADVNITDKIGHTTLDYARRGNADEVIMQALIKCGKKTQ